MINLSSDLSWGLPGHKQFPEFLIWMPKKYVDGYKVN